MGRKAVLAVIVVLTSLGAAVVADVDLQIKFEDVLNGMTAEIRAQSNPIQRAEIVRSHQKLARSMLASGKYRITNWRGELVSIVVAEQGDACVTIRSALPSSMITYSTAQSKCEDGADPPFTGRFDVGGTDIKRGSALYATLGKLSIGSKVRFSGVFVDGVGQAGIVYPPQLEDPLYSSPQCYMRLTSVSPE